jgi:hypothetical protein
MLNFEGRVGQSVASFNGQVSATGTGRDGTESLVGDSTLLP